MAQVGYADFKVIDEGGVVVTTGRTKSATAVKVAVSYLIHAPKDKRAQAKSFLEERRPFGWRRVGRHGTKSVRPVPPFCAPPEWAATCIFGVRLLP